jgi:hypothetical protein
MDNSCTEWDIWREKHDNQTKNKTICKTYIHGWKKPNVIIQKLFAWAMLLVIDDFVLLFFLLLLVKVSVVHDGGFQVVLWLASGLTLPPPLPQKINFVISM